MSARTCHGCDTELPPNKGGRGPQRKWCSDRCRKLTLYSRSCVDCGAVCNTDGRVTNASERCFECLKRNLHDSRRWTPESIVCAIQLWADEHGGVPPFATDWNQTVARKNGTVRPAEFPNVGTVQHEFGTWNAAIEAAGFQPFAPGHYGRDGEDPEIVAEAVRLYRAGLTCEEIGVRFGVTGQCIRHRLVVADEPRRRTGRRPKVAV